MIREYHNKNAPSRTGVVRSWAYCGGKEGDLHFARDCIRVNLFLDLYQQKKSESAESDLYGASSEFSAIRPHTVLDVSNRPLLAISFLT
jgi:hypothetical protein